MKKFMKTCYKCHVDVEEATVVKEDIKLQCLKCPKCGEEYFTSSELMKYDVLTGKRQMARKFGMLGETPIIRIPEKVMTDYGIKVGKDYGVFEEREEGILIKLVHVEE